MTSTLNTTERNPFYKILEMLGHEPHPVTIPLLDRIIEYINTEVPNTLKTHEDAVTVLTFLAEHRAVHLTQADNSLILYIRKLI